MDLRFDTPETDKRKEKIRSWAKRYKDVVRGSKKFTLEKELLELKKSKPEYLKEDQLELLVRWKSPRNLTYIMKNNGEAKIEKITQKALWSETENVCDSIHILTDKKEGLKGVGYSIGSAILHLFHKDDNYPIYDPHALRAVGKRPKDNVWESYVKFCRELAEDNEVCMRTLDRALYRFGYVLSVMKKIEGDLECLGVDALLRGMKYVVGRVLNDAKYAGRLTAKQIREELDLPDVRTPDNRPNILIVGVLMHLEEEGLAESIKHKGWQLTGKGMEWIETTLFHEGIAISAGDAKLPPEEL